MKEKEKRELFNQVYQDNKELIFRLCRGFLGPGPEAEDLFQEIFLKVWNNLESFRGQSKVSTWIYRIGTNTALLYRKRKARRQNREAPLLNTAVDQPHTGFFRIWKKRSATTGNWMHSFSSFNRSTNGSNHHDDALEGFSYKEIAEVSGLKVNHVGVRINRIKKHLRKKIKVS
jgi:DNA-directed RNA polymerase specialized sigma24 family protein